MHGVRIAFVMFMDTAAQPQSLWPILVSSSVISAAVSAGIVGLMNLRAKRNEYVNDYYKTVIKRRITPYEELEKFIVRLKASVVGDDNRPCHVMFVFSENAEDPRVSLVGLTAHRFGSATRFSLRPGSSTSCCSESSRAMRSSSERRIIKRSRRIGRSWKGSWQEIC